MAKPDDIIERYTKAYKAAYGRAPQVDYWRGWYSIFTGGVQWKARAGELVAAAERLEARA